MRGPHSVNGDTGFCLENNQQADGDSGTRLENDDGCSLKKQKHVTCLQKVNKQSSLVREGKKGEEPR